MPLKTREAEYQPVQETSLYRSLMKEEKFKGTVDSKIWQLCKG